MKKYELIESDKQGFYRIKALRDFGDVQKGDVGGYVQNENNLSHDRTCWVYDEAKVCENVRIYGNAKVSGNAEVCGNARIYEHAWVSGDAWIYGNVRIYGDAKVCGNARIYGEARVEQGLKESAEGKTVDAPEDFSRYVEQGEEHAQRFNTRKVDLSLLPKVACLEECKVWMYGEQKYGRDNWKKLWGEDTIRTAAASALRHLLAITSGELFDKESGLSNAASVRCNMAMILQYMAEQRLIEPEVFKEPEIEYDISGHKIVKRYDDGSYQVEVEGSVCNFYEVRRQE